jgi:catechol 2,3-dioxygenase-like lactoylglutathione lyase family enzyme
VIQKAQYVHTNLVARDFRALSQFYEDIFGCVPVPPERDYSGPELESGTGLPGAKLRGLHLRFPGVGAEGPTLEVFQYSTSTSNNSSRLDRIGFGHIAFAVPSVPDARAEVLAGGGSAVGEIVTLEPSAGSRVTWCYVRDPEGNIIELQSWA